MPPLCQRVVRAPLECVEQPRPEACHPRRLGRPGSNLRCTTWYGTPEAGTRTPCEQCLTPREQAALCLWYVKRAGGCLYVQSGGSGTHVSTQGRTRRCVAPAARIRRARTPRLWHSSRLGLGSVRSGPGQVRTNAELGGQVGGSWLGFVQELALTSHSSTRRPRPVPRATASA